MVELGRIALIGDLHGSWDDVDVDYFDRSNYDLLLFTGDIGSGTHGNGVQIARSVGRLAKPALVMPGNNDANDVAEIGSEFAHQRGLIELMKLSTPSPARELANASGQVRLCGYSLHPLQLGGREISLIAGRPFGLGGPELAFPAQLRHMHAVASLEDSTARLCSLFDAAPTEDVIVLSHNGPLGLGGMPTDIWGCDFRPEAGDWGDPDLGHALRHAERIGKRVLAVIAGHLHLRTRQGQERTWSVQRGETLYINPARVPRIYADADGDARHHAVLEISEHAVQVREVLVRDGF